MSIIYVNVFQAPNQRRSIASANKINLNKDRNITLQGHEDVTFNNQNMNKCNFPTKQSYICTHNFKFLQFSKLHSPVILDVKLIMPTLLILLFTIFIMVTVIPYAFSSVIKQLKAVRELEAAGRL